MKRRYISLAILAAATVFVSCSKDNDLLFDQSAAERLNAASDLYSARLEAQPNGWAMQLYPTTDDEAPYGSGYLLLLDFDKDHSVKVSMNNELTNNVYKSDTSAWAVITDDGPVLSFYTHNDIIHAFSDPEDVASTGTPDEPNDETGTGIGGDFEFVIVDAPEDASYMMLKGKKRGTYNLLTPVEQGVNYKSYLEDVNGFMGKMFSKTSPSFAVIHYGDSTCVFKDAYDGIPTIYPYGGDEVTQSTFNPFLVTKRGTDYYLRFRDKKTFGDVTVQDYKYDTQQDRFISVDNSAYFLEGDTASRFFSESLAADGTTWKIQAPADQTTGFGAVYKGVSDGFTAVKYTLQSVALRTSMSKLMLRLTYKTGKTTSTVDYIYVAKQDGDNVVFSYQGADKTAGQNILEKMPALKTLIDTIAQTFVVSAYDTRFNLSNLLLTSTTDSKMWMELSR